MEMRYLEGLEKRRKEALSNGNSPLFYELSEELGIDPVTPHEQSIYEVGQMESLSKRLREKGNSKLVSKLKDGARDRKLVDAVDSSRLNFKSPESGLDEKERILRELGYTRLTTGKGQYTPLEDCKPGRINMTLRKEYNLAVKRIKASAE